MQSLYPLSCAGAGRGRDRLRTRLETPVGVFGCVACECNDTSFEMSAEMRTTSKVMTEKWSTATGLSHGCRNRQNRRRLIALAPSATSAIPIPTTGPTPLARPMKGVTNGRTTYARMHRTADTISDREKALSALPDASPITASGVAGNGIAVHPARRMDPRGLTGRRGLSPIAESGGELRRPIA